MQRYAISLESAFLKEFRKFAASERVTIAITFVEAVGDEMFDSILLIDPRGEDLYRYSKMHTCDFSNEKYFTPGRPPGVVDLTIGEETVRIGSMICYDREFPETARILMLKGAEVVLIPNACTIERHRKGQLAARAFENMMGIVMANYAKPDQNGNSVAYSGVCFDDKLRELDDTLMEGDEDEAVLMADFDIEKIRRYREMAVWGDAYRKPHHYTELSSPEILEVFRRQDSRRVPPIDQ